MGLISVTIDLSDVDAIVIAVCTEPFDPDDALFEIDCHHQSIRVASYVEHDPVARDDARRSVKPFDIRGVRPSRLPHLVEPSIERRLERLLVSVPGARLDKLSKRPPWRRG